MDSFLGVSDFFCTHFRCFFVDLSGFGNSPITQVMTLDDYCDKVVELINYYDMQEVILVGHSFGGRIGIKLASKLPQIKAIVLVDSAGLKPRKTLKYYYRKCKFRIYKLFKLDTTKCGSPDYQKLDGIMKKTFVNVVNCYLDDYLEKINVSTLIIWGKKDKDTPLYMAKKLRKNIKNSGLVVLDGGHFCFLERFHQFVAILGSFVGDIYNVD